MGNQGVCGFPSDHFEKLLLAVGVAHIQQVRRGYSTYELGHQLICRCSLSLVNFQVERN